MTIIHKAIDTVSINFMVVAKVIKWYPCRIVCIHDLCRYDFPLYCIDTWGDSQPFQTVVNKNEVSYKTRLFWVLHRYAHLTGRGLLNLCWLWGVAQLPYGKIPHHSKMLTCLLPCIVAWRLNIALCLHMADLNLVFASLITKVKSSGIGFRNASLCALDTIPLD